MSPPGNSSGSTVKPSVVTMSRSRRRRRRQGGGIDGSVEQRVGEVAAEEPLDQLAHQPAAVAVGEGDAVSVHLRPGPVCGHCHDRPAPAASTIWPKLSPASLAGTASASSTRKPAASSPRSAACVSSRFWKQPPVRPTTADPELLAHPSGLIDQRRGEAGVKDRTALAGAEGDVEKNGQQRRPVAAPDAVLVAGQRQRDRRRAVVARGLQPHRPLALETYRLGNAGERGGRVEQPADGACLRRVQPPPPGMAEIVVGEYSAARPRRAGLPAQRQRAPPWLATGRLAARRRERAERGDPAPRARPADQRLAAPERSVGAVADAVPGEDQHRLTNLMLAGQRRRVSVVMEDPRQRQAAAPGPARPGVAGMGVGDDPLRRHPVKRLQIGDDLAEDGEPARRGEIADVRRDDCPFVPAERHRHLLLAADGEERAVEPDRQAHVQGRRPAPQPQRPGAAGDGAVDRIVGRAADRPVVVEKSVGDPPQAGLGLARVCQHRLAS